MERRQGPPLGGDAIARRSTHGVRDDGMGGRVALRDRNATACPRGGRARAKDNATDAGPRVRATQGAGLRGAKDRVKRRSAAQRQGIRRSHPYILSSPLSVCSKPTCARRLFPSHPSLLAPRVPSSDRAAEAKGSVAGAAQRNGIAGRFHSSS